MTKTRRWLIVPFVLLLISALFFPAIIVFAAPDTAVTVEPTPKKVGIGETFTVDIYVTPDTDIAGAQFDLSFTPSVITANSVTEGNLLSPGGSTYFDEGTINNGAGTITDVAGVITAAASVSSPGTFATISFTAGTTVGTSPLDLSNVIVGNPSGEPVATTVTDGSVTVYADWDVNMDGSVNVFDMILVGDHWGQSGAAHWIREDCKRDGAINVLDMILIGQYWTG